MLTNALFSPSSPKPLSQCSLISTGRQPDTSLLPPFSHLLCVKPIFTLALQIMIQRAAAARDHRFWCGRMTLFSLRLSHVRLMLQATMYRIFRVIPKHTVIQQNTKSSPAAFLCVLLFNWVAVSSHYH